jgi:hypothetical protein
MILSPRYGGYPQMPSKKSYINKINNKRIASFSIYCVHTGELYDRVPRPFKDHVELRHIFRLGTDMYLDLLKQAIRRLVNGN